MLAFGYCRCLRLCVIYIYIYIYIYICVCVCVCACLCLCLCQSQDFPCKNSTLLQARITKFGPLMQNISLKISIIWCGWLRHSFSYIFSETVACKHCSDYLATDRIFFGFWLKISLPWIIDGYFDPWSILKSIYSHRKPDIFRESLRCLFELTILTTSGVGASVLSYLVSGCGISKQRSSAETTWQNMGL